MRIFLIIVAIICGSLSSKAEYTREFLGYGSVYCNKINFANNFNGNIYFPWAQGYLSAMNAMLRLSNKKFVDFSVMSVDEEKAFLKDYCDKNPNSVYGFAVEALYERLIKLQQ